MVTSETMDSTDGTDRSVCVERQLETGLSGARNTRVTGAFLFVE